MAGRIVKITSFISWGLSICGILIITSYFLAQRIDKERSIETQKKKKIAVINQIRSSVEEIERGNSIKAIDMLDQIVKKHPDNFDAQMILTETLSKECTENDTLCDVALWQLSLFIEKYPKSVSGYELRQNVLLHLGDSTGASNDQKKILSLKLGF